MMQDATHHLKTAHQKLGKSVDRSRPYYEALKTAKYVSFSLTLGFSRIRDTIVLEHTLYYPKIISRYEKLLRK